MPADAWRRSKAAGLVKLLALAPGHRMHRERAMEALWPELPPTAAAANLRKAVHYARRAVDADESTSSIVSVGDVLALPAEHLWIDVVAWRAAVACARRTGDPQLYEEAVELYGDDWWEASNGPSPPTTLMTTKLIEIRPSSPGKNT